MVINCKDFEKTANDLFQNIWKIVDGEVDGFSVCVLDTKAISKQFVRLGQNPDWHSLEKATEQAVRMLAGHGDTIWLSSRNTLRPETFSNMKSVAIRAGNYYIGVDGLESEELNEFIAVRLAVMAGLYNAFDAKAVAGQTGNKLLYKMAEKAVRLVPAYSTADSTPGSRLSEWFERWSDD